MRRSKSVEGGAGSQRGDDLVEGESVGWQAYLRNGRAVGLWCSKEEADAQHCVVALASRVGSGILPSDARDGLKVELRGGGLRLRGEQSWS